MKLINTDGMAFIGPGSEWFWTALSGIVLAVTFLGIYRQLSLQRSAGAIEQLNRIEQEYQSERMLRVALELPQARHAGIDPAHLPQVAVVALVNFWERVAILARRGYIDLELFWEGGSGFYCRVIGSAFCLGSSRSGPKTRTRCWPNTSSGWSARSQPRPGGSESSLTTLRGRPRGWTTRSPHSAGTSRWKRRSAGKTSGPSSMTRHQRYRG